MSNNTSNKVKNVSQKVEGKVKETAGRVTGDAKLERSGKIDQVSGNAKQTGEKLKDAVRKK